MLFDRLGTGWAAFRSRLGSIRALVVDDEDFIRDLFQDLLAAEGFEVDVAHTAEMGLKLMAARRYDLLVTDKNLPGKSGLELIAELRAAGRDIPAVVITAYASMESVAEALRLGASDYITKPFDDVTHVAKRLKSVADHEMAERFYPKVIRDLKEAMLSSADRSAVELLARELAAYKVAVHNRLPVLFVDDEPSALARTLLGADVRTEAATTLDDARRRLLSEDGPLVTVLSLDMPEAVELLWEARAVDPLSEFLVTSRAPQLERSLQALHAGANDFVDAREGHEVLRTRTRRLLESARRHRLHVYLIAALFRRLHAISHPMAEMLASLLRPDHREYLETWVPPDAALPFMDLEELFPDSPGDFGLEANEVAQAVESIASPPVPPPDNSLVALIDPARAPHIGRLLDLGQRVAELIHEMRQPFTVIKSAAQLMATQPDPPMQLGALLEQVGRIEALIDRTAAYARRENETAPARPCHLNDAMLGAMALLGLGRDRRLSIYRDFEDDLPLVIADPMGLEQIFVNLLDNARAAMGEKPGRILLKTATVDDWVEAYVEDDGPGVPADIRATVFDPFVTKKAHGTGLGLHICRQIARSAGGELELMPSGRGALFRLRLPAAEGASASAPAR